MVHFLGTQFISPRLLAPMQTRVLLDKEWSLHLLTCMQQLSMIMELNSILGYNLDTASHSRRNRPSDNFLGSGRTTTRFKHTHSPLPHAPLMGQIVGSSTGNYICSQFFVSTISLKQRAGSMCCQWSHSHIYTVITHPRKDDRLNAHVFKSHGEYKNVQSQPSSLPSSMRL